MIRRSVVAAAVVLSGLAVAAPAHAVDPPFTGVRQVGAGFTHTCAVMASGQVRCWGSDASGQVGDDAGPGDTLPTTVASTQGEAPGPLTGITQLGTGAEHNCARDQFTLVHCWGEGDSYRLGRGGTADQPRPATVDNPTGDFSLTGIAQVASGWQHTCGRTTDRRVLCWGANALGQLGDGTTTDRPRPVVVRNRNGRPLRDVVSIAAGSFHTCAVLSDRTARCWGDNLAGAVGDGTTTNRRRPTVVRAVSGNGPLRGVLGITGGSSSTCARVEGNQARCWGYNASRQLGMVGAPATNRARPVVVERARDGRPLTGVVQVSSGSVFSCARLRNGQAWCWGFDEQGQRGDADNPAVAGARPVRGPTDEFEDDPPTQLNGVLQIDAGGDHACARRRVDGEVRLYCWGDNTYRQLGRGTANPFGDRPAPVLAPPEQSEQG